MITVLTGLSTIAQAQEYGAQFFAAVEKPVAEVKESSLTLLGKGIRERGTDRSVALACMNADCTEIRFVYFAPNKKAFLIGPHYQYSGKTAWVTPAAIRAGSRQVLKEVIAKVRIKTTSAIRSMFSSGPATLEAPAVEEFNDSFIDDDSEMVKVSASNEGWLGSLRQKKKDVELFREILCSINQRQPLSIIEDEKSSELISCVN